MILSKKSCFFTATIILLVLFIVLTKASKPNKIIQIGSQVSESSYEFSEEIKDKEKIAEFEEWFDKIDFKKETEKPDGYADLIVQIRYYREGTMTNPVSIWFDDYESTVINGIGSEGEIGKLSNSQLENLLSIIGLK
ncbi:MAG: hypothetical protein WBA84_04945 [Carnobacterium sp.]|uniref:hypothetical protein n=1 Tax=Carnobacterium sp. TaxID=48221 RepID=UPI003C783BB6